MECKRKNIWIKVLICTAVFAAAAFLLGFCWETNDDPKIATYLSRLECGIAFQWHLLSWVMNYLYLTFPVVDWWAFCNVSTVILSAAAIFYVTYRRYQGFISHCITAVVMILLWYAAFGVMNFTRTAAAASLAGILLIADAIFTEGKWCIGRTWQYVLGIIFLLHGASIRNECALIALAFLALIGLIHLLGQGISFRWEWLKARIFPGMLLCLAAALYFGAFFADNALLTQEEKLFLEYNAARADINDYESQYPSYEEAAREYLSASWDETAIAAFAEWTSEDTEVFTVSSMKEIGKLRVKNDSVSGILREYVAMTRGSRYFALALLLVLSLCALEKGNWKKSLAILAMFILLSVYLIIAGRLPARVYESIMLCGALSAVFVCGTGTGVAYKPDGAQEKSALIHRMGRCGSLAMAGTLVIQIFLGAVLVGNLYYNTRFVRNPARWHVVTEENRRIMDHINQDREHIYLIPGASQPAPMEYTFGFWEVQPADYCINRFYLGGWPARMPYNVKLLAQQGITNPMRSLFERTDVYSTYDGVLLNYLRSYYDPKMTASGTRTAGGVVYCQYSGAIPDGTAAYEDGYKLLSCHFTEETEDAEGTWDFSGEINVSSPGERVFYCNLTYGGQRYTYRLGCEGNRVFGRFYELDAAFSPEDADIMVFEMTEDGKYLGYSVS